MERRPTTGTPSSPPGLSPTAPSPHRRVTRGRPPGTGLPGSGAPETPDGGSGPADTRRPVRGTVTLRPRHRLPRPRPAPPRSVPSAHHGHRPRRPRPHRAHASPRPAHHHHRHAVRLRRTHPSRRRRHNATPHLLSLRPVLRRPAHHLTHSRAAQQSHCRTGPDHAGRAPPRPSRTCPEGRPTPPKPSARPAFRVVRRVRRGGGPDTWHY